MLCRLIIFIIFVRPLLALDSFRCYEKPARGQVLVNCEHTLYLSKWNYEKYAEYIYCESEFIKDGDVLDMQAIHYIERRGIRHEDVNRMEMVNCRSSIVSTILPHFKQAHAIDLHETGFSRASCEWINNFSHLRRLTLRSNQIDQLEILSCLPKHLAELNMQHNQIRSIAEIKAWNRADLKQLLLDDNDIAAIEPNAFRGLVRLETLTLANNNVTRLVIGTFNTLARLMTLDLHNNSIGAVDAATFAGLTSLMILDLSSNKIASFAIGTFDDLGHLRNLSLQSNQIVAVQAMLFVKLNALQHLNLRSNNISAIETGAFDGCHRLESLNLAFNHITIMQTGVYFNISKMRNRTFAKLTAGSALQRLDLHSNDIGDVEPMALAGLHKLTALNLAINRIGQLTNQHFPDLEALQTLNLSHNRIASIEPSTFNSTGNLEVLDLSYNDFARLAVGTFGHLSKLRDLDLSHASLEAITIGTFAETKNLASLNLAYNKLRRLNYVLFAPSMPLLEVLRLNGNLLTALTTETKRLFPRLSTLDISNNRFNCLYLHETLMPSIDGKALRNATKADLHASNVHGINCVDSGEHVEPVEWHSQAFGNGRVHLQDAHSMANVVGFSIVIVLLVLFIGVYAYNNRYRIFHFTDDGANIIELNDVASVTSKNAILTIG